MGIRIGIGTDLHRLVEGRKLILGGVEIPYNKGLLGHSDGDVVIHSIIDALLGSAGLGDIGEFFPDTDLKYKNIDSKKLLQEVVEIIKDKGFRVNNIDVIIHAESPKLKNYKLRMKETLSRIVEIEPDRVNIKAKTNEGLGVIGEGKAISATAVVKVIEGGERGRKIYNTLTRRKEEFIPVEDKNVGIYLCGPTVYKPSHIGHTVGPVIFDTVKRWLEYRGYKVKLVINITDVDDKIIQEAKRLGKDMKTLAEEVTADYLRAMERLNVSPPDVLPKATEHIKDIQEFIQKLIDKGFAYVLDGDVYFDVQKFSEYGKLSGQTLDKQFAHSRELKSSDKKHHPADFALWKKSPDDEPGWDSPWGRGRPGWHIECSVMSMKHIGQTIDIHGGGMDLIFPHHENEIAQSEALTGKQFVKYWMHNGLTRVDTKKMSKSEGNIRLISDLLEEFSGEVIRFFILSTHYRRPIDFSDEQIRKVARGMQTFYRLFSRVKQITGKDVYRDSFDVDANLPEGMDKLADEFDSAMDDDFNTAEAIALLFKMSNLLNAFIEENKLSSSSDEKLKRSLIAGMNIFLSKAHLLGLFEKPVEQTKQGQLTDDLIALLIEIRADARKQKLFDFADKIRDRLSALGIKLKDTPQGTTWEVEL